MSARLNSRRRNVLVRAAHIEQLEQRRLLATITVTTAVDELAPNNSAVSLREAITAIDAGNNLGDSDIIAQNPGAFGTNDTIDFNIPDGGVQTIHVGALPVVDPTALTESGNTVTVTADNDFVTGEEVVIAGVTPAGYNGTYTIATATPTNFTYVDATTGLPDATVFGTATVVTGPLPTITQSVTIDGTSQPGFDPSTNAPIIELDGESAGTTNGLSIIGANAGHSTIRGLIINRFENTGVYVDPAAGNTNNLIAGNYIGTDPTGTIPEGNGDYGVFIANDDNTIGGSDAADRNVISGNHQSGIGFGNGTPSDNTVEGNYIGTDVTGTSALGNNHEGIEIFIGTSNTFIGGDTVGAGNLISGNLRDGVSITQSDHNTLEGNFIGTDVTGEVAIPNAAEGVFVTQSQFATIGGTSDGAGNLISGNTGNGLTFDVASNSQAQGNIVGLDASATAILPNGLNGINLAGTGTSHITIGGLSEAARNIISGNHLNGVELLEADNAVIEGNSIGTNTDGTAGLGNLGDGIQVDNSSEDNQIGGLTGNGNVIAFNARNGVGLTASAGVGNSILSNSIYSNVLLGVDMFEDGVTANDTNDTDTGPNDVQNTAILTAAASDSTHTIIDGGFSAGSSIEPFTIQFFSSPTADPSGNGEGMTLLGTTFVNRDNSKNVTFSADLPVVVTPSQYITALVTNGIDNSTSEFSNAIQVSHLGPPPTISIDDVALPEGNSGPTGFTFTVSLSDASLQPITVAYATFDGSATSNADYFAQNNVLTFNPGETSKTFTVNVIGDTAIESDEVFGVNLSSPTNATIADGQGVGTIINDDTPPPPPPTLSINDVTHNEQNSGTHTFTFTVTRSGDTSGTSDVFYSTANGSATAGSDYTAIPLTPLHFDANQTTATIVVNEQGDTTVEGDETFTVNLSNPTNATIADGTGVGTIVNDDAAPPPPPASGSVSVITDPCDSTKKAIEIDGTDNADTITVTKSGSSQGKAVVKINGVNKGTFSFSGSIVVYGKGGSDNISIDSTITRSAYIWGGEGNDTVNGGGGNDIIFGQGNDDSLNGNGGRDILVGGDGTDKLNGGSGDDLLIAGDFKSAPSMSQLCSIQKEWTRTDKTYAKRVTDLTNGGGFNSIKLNSSTLFSSTSLKDSMTGGADSDLFFAAMTGDKITDKASGETAVNIG